MCSYAELNGNREEVDTGLLGNLLTTRDTGKVDVAGLNKALGTGNSLQQLLGEPINCVSLISLTPLLTRVDLPVASIGHRQSCGAETVLSLDNLITTELNPVD